MRESSVPIRGEIPHPNSPTVGSQNHSEGSEPPPKRSYALVPLSGQEGAPRVADKANFSLVKFAHSAYSTPRESPCSSPDRSPRMVAEVGHPLETANEETVSEPPEITLESDILTDRALQNILARKMANVRRVDSVLVAPPADTRLVLGKTEMDYFSPMIPIIPSDVPTDVLGSTVAQSAQPHISVHEHAQVHDLLARPRPSFQWLRDMLQRRPPPGHSKFGRGWGHIICRPRKPPCAYATTSPVKTCTQRGLGPDPQGTEVFQG
jgi:hypothetical protein